MRWTVGDRVMNEMTLISPTPGPIPLLPVSGVATLVSDGENPHLIFHMAVHDREGKAPAEQPVIRRFLSRSSFWILHGGPDDGHDLLEDLTPKARLTALVEP
jgi:hypothetical protein